MYEPGHLAGRVMALFQHRFADSDLELGHGSGDV
ncbi:hypothetical protein MED297_12832 [Reinekea blandensis MED297]|uniref:Uncharacterized protein n=1 Tax=Reinekea blandensis MED297 TaxID=314283 RepID=A4BED8_9GAMM|nr:hypothetical protein MED297_12832 [Reinekea blandensis MED297]